ncbi:MAG: ABC transporter permease [Pedobacter sp.]|uniref:ABC transporter permease n=1 Tax=Pedobacter sp. TaxID=1411316 RepID=UPI0033974448
MLYLNFKIALRNILKKAGFSLINIGGLAIGLSCCLMLLLYVNYELGYDEQFEDADDIYLAQLNLKLNEGIMTSAYVPNKLAGAALQTIPGIEAAARFQSDGRGVLFSRAENKFKFEALNVDPAFLKIFSYHFLQGDPNTALNEPNAAVITQGTAKKLFGNENPIGQRIQWDNVQQLKVTGVIEDLPKNQSIQFDVLQTWAFFDQLNPENKNSGWASIVCNTVFKVKKGASFAETDAGIRKLIKMNDKGTIMEAFLFPLTKIHLYDDFKNGKSAGGNIDTVRLFVFLAFCVLLIASINYMNLSTAQSEKRAKEVGVRKALGSDRRSLMGQFFIESLLLSFLAMVIAFALLELALPYFNNLLNISIQIGYQSYTFWLILLGLVLFTGIIAGSYPAFYLSSFTPVKVLKGFTGIGKSSLPIRKILVVLQFSLSICMIICAIVIYSQIQYVKNRPLGFEQDNLVQMDREGEFLQSGKLALLKSELLKSGAVISATEHDDDFTSNGGHITGNLSWPGKNIKDIFTVNYRSIGYDFAKTVGAKIIEGNDLRPVYPVDNGTDILVNEAALKLMGLKNPIGRKIKWGNADIRIVGVIGDYQNMTVTSKPQPTIFHYETASSHTLLFRLNPAQSLNASVKSIKEIAERLNPAYPVNLSFVSSGMSDKLKTERILGVLSNLFGGFAILISCLGLLGLALYMAEQRRKEISIRKVLGADLQSILVLLNKDFIKLVILSNVIAFPAAYLLAINWLQKYDYKVTLAVWPFLIAGSVSLVIAVLTVSAQSYKVARANPVDALKAD